jgi:hypothetical protein
MSTRIEFTINKFFAWANKNDVAMYPLSSTVHLGIGMNGDFYRIEMLSPVLVFPIPLEEALELSLWIVPEGQWERMMKDLKLRNLELHQRFLEKKNAVLERLGKGERK